MTTPLIQEHLDKGLLTIAFNRPERKNAFISEMTVGFREALERARDNPDVRAIIVTGNGGAFSVGGDVKGMATVKDPEAIAQRRALFRRNARASALLHHMPKPTIAMISGAVAGAGLSLALACDMRFASEDAKLTPAFAKVGLSGDYGATYFLHKILGYSKAYQFMLTSPVLDGRQALELGIVDRVYRPDALEAETRAFAAQLARGPTTAYAAIKQNLLNSTTGSIEDCIDGECDNIDRCQQTADHVEAAKAFLEKRKPNFIGR